MSIFILYFFTNHEGGVHYDNPCRRYPLLKELYNLFIKRSRMAVKVDHPYDSRRPAHNVVLIRFVYANKKVVREERYDPWAFCKRLKQQAREKNG
jgi:hypothetical protein